MLSFSSSFDEIDAIEFIEDLNNNVGGSSSMDDNSGREYIEVIKGNLQKLCFTLFPKTLRNEMKIWEISLDNKEKDIENRHNAWSRLNKVTQQTIDVVFVSDMLKSTYNKIKITLGLMARNYKEWDDNNLTKMQWWHFKAK
uniref:Uncharacterized protein n=1 Tax=Cucumis melo TaxID=3656 RepID=A0A9I9E852_CUCME